MTPAELLKPRYKVIADYFYNPYKIGDIITVLYDDRSVHLTTTRYRDEFGETVDQANYYNPARLKDFPHLFQPLQWWEGRKEEEMPEYLKSVSGLEVYQRVSRIDGAQVAMVRFPNGKYGKGTIGPIGLLNLLPATEAEYLEYIKQK